MAGRRRKPIRDPAKLARVIAFQRVYADFRAEAVGKSFTRADGDVIGSPPSVARPTGPATTRAFCTDDTVVRECGLGAHRNGDYIDGSLADNVPPDHYRKLMLAEGWVVQKDGSLLPPGVTET